MLKRRYIIVFIAIFGLQGAQVCAQETEKKDIRKNHISFDPLLPLFGTFQIQYERAISDDFSAGVSFGYKNSSGLFEVSKISFDRFDSDDLNFSGYKIIPEVRWYFQNNKTGLNGLYLGAYFTHKDISADLAGVYESSEGVTSDILIESNIRSSTFGVEIGYKWEFESGFFIDFIFAGPGYGTANITLTEIEPVPDSFYDDLSEALIDIGIIDYLDPDFRVDGDQATKISLPAWRYGIKFGYAF